MPTRSYNHLVIDLNKAAFAWHYWRNQHGEVRRLKPTKPSCRGMTFDPKETVTLCINNGSSFEGQELPPPKITLLQLAEVRGCLDHWTPVTRFRMTCSDILEFTGDKAQSLWKAWNEKQFKKR